LTSALGSDDYNFTITLGIFIYCEDNDPAFDLDTWTMIRIKSFNLTFSYEKNIDRNTYADWNQVGNELPQTPGTLLVDSARLHFRYRSNQSWPTADSPNAEIRMLINNIPHSETVKLSSATASFQDAKTGGYDVTPLIQKNVNITLSLRVYLADNFILNNSITISIDDVYLWINYTITLDEPSLSVVANTTYLFVNQTTQMTVTCDNGTGLVDTLWYYHPLNTTNYTIATDFTGQQIHLLNFTSATPGAKLFRFWANSSIGLESYDEVLVVWVQSTAPTLSVTANVTNLFMLDYTNITVTCENGSGLVDTLWYFNPITGSNTTLATDFTGIQSFSIYDTSTIAGPYIYQFWANSSLGIEVYDDITIVWVEPQPPILTVLANTTSLFLTQWVQINVSCLSGTGNISRVWYENPFTGSNITLGTNFAGLQTFYVYNTTLIAGSYEYKFWANSTYRVNVSTSIIIVWVTPVPPLLTVVANITNPYTNDWTNLTVTCQSGSGNVSRLWYNNPFDGTNNTIATDFSGFQIHYLAFTNDTAGQYEFKFWANSTLGLLATESVTVMWVEPQPPALTVSANDTTPDVNEWTQLTITCQSGSGSVSRLWYNNPFDGTNNTLATDFTGLQTHYVDFMNDTAGPYEFKVWANSSLGLEVTESVTVVWVEPLPPALTLIANTTNPFINFWTEITLGCQSGSGNVSHVWYENPFTGTNITLGTNFAGYQIFYVYNMSTTPVIQEYKFWANSTLGLETFDSIIIVWAEPQPPALNVLANTTTLYLDLTVQINVSCLSGSGNVSHVWYENPFTGTNITLGTNFAGLQTFYVYNASPTAGPYQYTFWANSTFLAEESTSLMIVWVTPVPPLLNVIANITDPYTNDWTELTVTCQPGSVNVSHLWYLNPFIGSNTTLATNFVLLQAFPITNQSPTAGAYEYKFWANTSLGEEVYAFITVVWVDPLPPTLDVSANTTVLDVNEWVQFNVTCENGSGLVDTLWYHNPLLGSNTTLANDFTGSQTYYLDFTSLTPGPYDFKFWANSTFDLEVSETITITWTALSPPSLTVSASPQNPETKKNTYINVTCTSGSGNVSHLWYLNPFTGINVTLATNFSGFYSEILIFTRSEAGEFEFKFWANSTFGLDAIPVSVLVNWIAPSFTWLIWTLVGVLGAVAGAFTVYQLYFKVPKTIRTIRKTKRDINKGKETPPLDLKKREAMVEDIYLEKLKLGKIGKAPVAKPEPETISVLKKSKGME
ncbi:MAG: hypothetical protein HWN66_16740, partial [Candidatus Helarchaeota archaeon]|nr:hypothetical protein [Candidatus Helarchaeota archaeon]